MPHKGQREHGTSAGTLIIIGGHEDKDNDRVILNEIARRVGSGRLVVTTVASHEPEGYFEPYERTFNELGVKDVVELTIRERGEAFDESKTELLNHATGLFFTGGDQLKLASQLGDTPIWRCAREIFANGGVIAGTSAGASAMCETMLVSGSAEESHRIGDLKMAPGMGLIRDVIIDQHFAERGRMGRLLGAVAHSPRILGIGIDEDTAIVVEESQHAFSVIGSGAVYVVDGTEVTYSNIAEEACGSTLSFFNVKLHVLSHGDVFNMVRRQPECR